MVAPERPTTTVDELRGELDVIADLIDAVAGAIRETGKGGLGKVPAAYLDGWSARIRAVGEKLPALTGEGG